jgi:Oligoketide cyclase/lipid transport protein
MSDFLPPASLASNTFPESWPTEVDIHNSIPRWQYHLMLHSCWVCHVTRYLVEVEHWFWIMHSKCLPTLYPLFRSSPFRRSLSILPDLSKLSPWGSETQTYHEHKNFPCVGWMELLICPLFYLMFSYTQNQLYNIVADVSLYPRFVPFCTASRILNTSTQRQTGDISSQSLLMEAELTVTFLTFKESYVSQVRCTPFKSVEVCQGIRDSHDTRDSVFFRL